MKSPTAILKANTMIPTLGAITTMSDRLRFGAALLVLIVLVASVLVLPQSSVCKSIYIGGMLMAGCPER